MFVKRQVIKGANLDQKYRLVKLNSNFSNCLDLRSTQCNFQGKYFVTDIAYNGYDNNKMSAFCQFYHCFNILFR